jgi:DsbC/DsbD-like thiol-disulfide interchange protein
MANPIQQIPFAAACLLAIAGAAQGQFDLRGGQQQRTAEQLTRVQVVSDVTHDVMPGETVNIAVVYTIEPRWHLYWKNPGEGAPPPSVRVEAPEGWTVGEIRWPRPKVLPSPVGDMYCYEGEFALFIPVTAPDDLADGQARFSINTNWAVCDSNLCLFGTARRGISLPTTASTYRTLDMRPVHPLIERHRRTIARPLEDDGASMELRGETIRVTVPAHGPHDTIAFFPHQSPGVTYGQARFARRGNTYFGEIDLEIDPNNFLDGPPAVGGLIALGEKPDDPSYEFSMPLAEQ